MSEFAEELRELRFSPSGGLSDDDFVSRVMAACATAAETETALESRPKPARPRAAVWALGGALATAAALALRLAAWPPTVPLPGKGQDGGGTVTARGAETGALTATVQAFVGHAAPGAALPLLEGATLGPGDGILVRYSNPQPRDAYLMVFALDEQHTVHWLHPAYVDAATNPTSLKLQREVTERVLPEVAEPENPAPGALRVYALLSRTPFDVKSVERKLGTDAANVPELFPEAEVEEWRCTWRAR